MKAVPYAVPPWATSVLLNHPSAGRLNLANLPTPIHKLNTSNFQGSMLQVCKELNVELYIKRDDMSGGPELGGNKIRKLEFLLSDAIQQKTNCVVTIGGEQSNHCRATASASRLVGLEPHLILRTPKVVTKKADDEEEGASLLGLKGNLMFDRLVGSHIYTVTPGEYGRFGQKALVEQVCTLLKENGRKPFSIPVGGSNALGTWGYLEGVNELMQQLSENDDNDDDKQNSSNNPSSTLPQMDHVVFACGSGGTLTGIALGIHLYHEYYNNNHNGRRRRVAPHCHAIGVCDNPDYFYEMLQTIGYELGLSENTTTKEMLDKLKQRTTIHDGKGLGYAKSTTDEMTFIQQFAIDTGIVLDPVYSGKALYHFITHEILKNPSIYKNSKILFWHTGGSLGIYDHDVSLLTSLHKEGSSKVSRLDVYGNAKKKATDSEK